MIVDKHHFLTPQGGLCVLDIHSSAPLLGYRAEGISFTRDQFFENLRITSKF